MCFRETVVHIYQSAQHDLNTHCQDNLNPLHSAVMVDPTFQIWLAIWYIEQAPFTICTSHSLHLGPVTTIFTLPIASAICWYLEKPCVLAVSLSVWWKSLERPCSNVNRKIRVLNDGQCRSMQVEMVTSQFHWNFLEI